MEKHDKRDLPNTDKYADCLVRLPMYYELEDSQIDNIIDLIVNTYE
jgi:dTDP-4-amino-4,6-dideoxygalactose transaminase